MYDFTRTNASMRDCFIVLHGNIETKYRFAVSKYLFRISIRRNAHPKTWFSLHSSLSWFTRLCIQCDFNSLGKCSTIFSWLTHFMGQYIKFSAVHFGFVLDFGFSRIVKNLAWNFTFCCINFRFITSKLIASKAEWRSKARKKYYIQYQGKSYANDTCFLGIISLLFTTYVCNGRKNFATVSFLRCCFFFFDVFHLLITIIYLAENNRHNTISAQCRCGIEWKW